MTTLTVYDGRFSRLKEERDNIIKAKEALELAEPGNNEYTIPLHVYTLYIYLYLHLCMYKNSSKRYWMLL